MSTDTDIQDKQDEYKMEGNQIVTLANKRPSHHLKFFAIIAKEGGMSTM